MAQRLLALDLDGTLLRRDGTVHPDDVAAVHRARDAGVHVTIATGRMASGTLPTARTLGLTAPVICADGAALFCGESGRRLESRTIAPAVARSAVELFDAHALVPFILTHDAVHCDVRGEPYTPYVSLWTRGLSVHAHLASAPDWHEEGDVAFTLALGTEAAVAQAHSALVASHEGHVDVTSFRAGRTDDRWALLTRPRGCTKGTALSSLAARMGIPRERVAAVGDWLNDIPMLQWAGRSFVMGGAPAGVRAVATDGLTAIAGEGGGVAEAITRWLHDSKS